jgi:hypothetical protein
MNRSFLISALVLALAAAACGGGEAGTDGVKAPDGEKAAEGGGDAIADVKGAIEGIQKEIDGLMEPIKNADAVIDAVKSIPADLKAAKSKADPKKLLEVAKKMVESGEYNLDGIAGLEGDAKAKVTEKLDKMKALVASIKNIASGEAIKAISQKVTDLPGKLPAAVAQGAKSLAKSKMPFGVSAEDKAKAQKDVEAVDQLKTQVPAKATQWAQDLKDIPGKAASIPKKMADAFK